jgi:type IV secretory pathway ATPase VirB11/archaellum biosynthesis ATPase
MVESPTIIELIQNGTISPQMAATLWAAIDKRCSFVVVAVPRLAGKTTLMHALLELLPASEPIHILSGDQAEMDRLKKTPKGGYLVVGEVSQAPVPHYIWGAPVRRLFDTLSNGYSLATALHASSLEETIDVLCRGNGVPDEHASNIKLIIYLQRFGSNPDDFWRRLSEIHEIERVENGRPVGRLLHRWDEKSGHFEVCEDSVVLQITAENLQVRASQLKQMADSGQTSAREVAKMVETSAKNL